MFNVILAGYRMNSNPQGNYFGQWGGYAVAAIISVITIIFFISSSPRTGLYDVLLFSLLLCVYMLPTIIASKRRHRNQNAIAILNILFGWTFVGWVIALVWSFIDTEKVSTGGGFPMIRNLIEVLERKIGVSADVVAPWALYVVVGAVAAMFLGAAVTYYLFSERAFLFRW
jgi:hypothetical protein